MSQDISHTKLSSLLGQSRDKIAEAALVTDLPFVDVQDELVECHQVQEFLGPSHMLESLLHLNLRQHSAHRLLLRKLLKALHGDACFVLDGGDVEEELAQLDKALVDAIAALNWMNSFKGSESLYISNRAAALLCQLDSIPNYS